MVKIGALIGAFFTTTGGFFLIFALSSIFDSSLIPAVTWETVRDAVTFSSESISFLGIFSIIAFYFGIMLVLGSGFIKGKLFLKIGGGVMILGIVNVIISWFIGGFYGILYYIAGIIMFIGVVLYSVGCVQYRKHNIFPIFTGFLLVLSMLITQIILGTIITAFSNPTDIITRIHFINLIIQTILFILHSWIFSFSKKQVKFSDDVEDNLSIEKGLAFESHVHDDVKKEKKKSEEPTEDDEITFTF